MKMGTTKEQSKETEQKIYRRGKAVSRCRTVAEGKKKFKEKSILGGVLSRRELRFN
jgi:hypothetical protein